MKKEILSPNTALNSRTSKIHDFLIKFLSLQKNPEIAQYFDGELGRVVNRFKIEVINSQRKEEISNNKKLCSLSCFLAGVYYGLQAFEENNSLNHNELKTVITNALIDLD